MRGDTLGLLQAVGEYRLRYVKLLVDRLHPDIIISHDDWGSKANMFISPQTGGSLSSLSF